MMQNGVTSKSINGHAKPTYALEHLATFKVRNATEITQPKEKIKLLMNLDKNGGIWPQKMYMCFSEQWLLMLDSNLREIENFPGSLITEPTAFISDDPLEAFNNILIFTVKGVSLGNTEMHAFHVIDVPAAKLVEDLKQLSNGNIITIDRNPTARKQDKPDINRVHDQYGIAAAAAEAASEKKQEGRQQTERDILVLNHCFEDIERFVARIQYACEAIRELESRKNQHNPHGEGLLLLRSRPPTESEFTDILAKHKLAFNYLEKLQIHFNQPSEPLHHMFVSLQAIVSVCNDVYVDAQIPEKVVNPLLRRATVSFLQGTLNVKEMDMWQSLGPNWTTPKESFQNVQGSYHPIFYNEWSPDWVVDEEVNYKPNITKQMSNHSSIAPSPKLNMDKNLTWHSRLKTRNVKIAEVKSSKTASNDKELSVACGEFLEVLDDSRNWWKCRNATGGIGYVPHTILKAQNFDEQSQYSERDNESIISSAAEQHEINRVILNTPPPGRGVARALSQPVVPQPPPLPPQEAESLPSTPSDTAMLSPVTRAAMRARTNGDMESILIQSTINEELKNTLMKRAQRKDLEILVTPQIYINKNSGPNEIKDWLCGKGFSETIVKKLSGLNGEEIFALTPHDFENYFGQNPESRRLISQLVLQKNISEYKTVRSTELAAKLKKVRERVNSEEE